MKFWEKKYGFQNRFAIIIFREGIFNADVWQKLRILIQGWFFENKKDALRWGPVNFKNGIIHADIDILSSTSSDVKKSDGFGVDQ